MIGLTLTRPVGEEVNAPRVGTDPQVEAVSPDVAGFLKMARALEAVLATDPRFREYSTAKYHVTEAAKSLRTAYGMLS